MSNSETTGHSSRFSAVLTALLPYAALILILAVMGARDGWRVSNAQRVTFYTLDNFITLAKECAPVIVAAAGMTLMIVAGGIDLSVGSVIGLAGAVAGYSANYFHSPLAGIALGMTAGFACGLFNGALTVGLSLPPFITTLATLMTFRGACELVTNNGSIFVGEGLPSNQSVAFHAAFQWISNGRLFGTDLPVSIVVVCAVIAVLWVVLNLTRFGRRVYAVGSNAEAARLSGVRVWSVRMWVYALCGLMAGLAGVLASARVGGPEAKAGTGMELTVISAVVIGGASLNGGQGKVSGCVIGAALMAVLSNACTSLGISDSWQKIIIGLFLAGAVAVDRMRKS